MVTQKYVMTQLRVQKHQQNIFAKLWTENNRSGGSFEIGRVSQTSGANKPLKLVSDFASDALFTEGICVLVEN